MKRAETQDLYAQISQPRPKYMFPDNTFVITTPLDQGTLDHKSWGGFRRIFRLLVLVIWFKLIRYPKEQIRELKD